MDSSLNLGLSLDLSYSDSCCTRDLDSNSGGGRLWEKERGNDPLSVIAREFIVRSGWLKHVLLCHQSP
jgi:hypothetical protein